MHNTTIKYRIPDITRTPFGGDIPRIIHQTFPTKFLPDQLRKNVETLRGENPEWIHVLYDDTDIELFIAKEYSQDILGYYRRIDPKYGAARADLFRYLLLYRYGGVYLDIKSGLSHSLNIALRSNDVFILSQWDTSILGRAGFGVHSEISQAGGEFQQWQIMSAPGHPFLRAVIEAVLVNIDSYSPWRQGTGGDGVFRVTGPIAYTLAIEPLLTKYPHRLVKDTEFGLIYSVIKSDHKTVFKNHYLWRTDPIIIEKGLKRILGLAYSFARKTKRLLNGIRI